MPEDALTRIIVSLPVFLLAIVLHEVAHGYVAYLCGDDTAKRAGRLTLSPLSHLDPIGTIFFVVSTLSGVGFGWAKPVPVSLERLRHPGRDDVFVTLAGPAANGAQAVAWALLFRLALSNLAVQTLSPSLLQALLGFFLIGVLVNLGLLVFNLLPIPPLDGSHVAARLLGIRDPYLIGRLAPLGLIALLLFMRTPAWDALWRVVVDPLVALLIGSPLGA
jgi:Zn-dependent protease